MVVINKAGGAGGEGFLDVKASRGNPHKLVITLSNLFTTPLATGIPFNWKDLTPVAMLALDEFVLWVNAETPYKTVEGLHRRRSRPRRPAQFKMGGTGSKQEDQIITVALEKAAGVKFTYIPFRGGGEVAVQLVGNHVDSTVNNPIEAVAQWRAGKLRPLCVFDGKPLPYNDKIAGDMAWSDIPTCKSQGLDIEYLMLRGIFMPPGVTKEQVDYYVDLLKKVRETPEWKQLMNERRVQPDLHDRRRLRQVGRERRKAPPRADEGRRLPRHQLTDRMRMHAAGGSIRRRRLSSAEGLHERMHQHECRGPVSSPRRNRRRACHGRCSD